MLHMGRILLPHLVLMKSLHQPWIKVLVCILFGLAIFIAFSFYAMKAMAIPLYCLEEKLPDEASLQQYLMQADREILPTLRENLKAINDTKSATDSIPKLIHLGAACSGLYESSAVLQTEQSSDAFAAKIVRLIQQESAYTPLNKEVTDDILREYRRLATHNFYECPHLELTLRLYFFEQAGDAIFPLWQPMGMIRYHLARRHLPLSAKSVNQLFSQLYDGPCIKDPRCDNISILFLDYYDRSSMDQRGDFRLIAPARPTIRGRYAVFDDCLCTRYCFNYDDSITYHSTSLGYAHSSELHGLSREMAKRLKEYVGEKRWNDDSVFFIYRLSPPFLSAYLILSYNKDEPYCSSLMFSDEYP